MATVTKPMALDKTFNTTETTPRSQADVLAAIENAIRQGFGRSAADVSYDNTTSGLTADDVQEAIDELAAEKVDKVEGKGLSSNDFTDEDKAALDNMELDIESTQTASGNPITLTDCAPINAESLVVELEPKQDLHGYDHPWVGGAGNNKYIGSPSFDGYETISVWTLQSETYNGHEVYKRSGAWFGTYKLIYLPVGTYTFSVMAKTNDGGIIYLFPLLENTTSATTSPAQAYFDTSTEWHRYYYTFDVTVAGTVAFRAERGSVGDIYVSEYQLEIGSQVTDYSPYKNICPISGYEGVEVDDVGFNRFNVNTDVVNNAYINDANGNAESSTGYKCTKPIDVVGGETYYIKSEQSGGRWGAWYDDANNFISGISGADYYGKPILAPQNAKYIRFTIQTPSGTNVGNPDTVCFNISKPTGTPKNGDYDPYQSSNATIQFGQTVYGGKVDFLTGVLTVTHGIVDLGSLNYTYQSLSGGRNGFSTPIEDMRFTTGGNDRLPAISSIYKAVRYNDNWNDGYMSYFYPTGKTIVFINNAYTDAASFKTAMEGQTLCYELAEPTTIQLTPQELKLLKGTNNITTNGTTITLGYQPDNVIGEVKGEIEDITPISGTATVTLLHEEDQGEDWIVGFTGEINGHFDTDHFDYYLTARYTHAYNTNTQILNMDNCTDGDYVNIWQTGTLDFSVDGGVTVDISVTATKLTFTVNCIGDSIFGIYSSSEPTGQVKYLITPARKG